MGFTKGERSVINVDVSSEVANQITDVQNRTSDYVLNGDRGLHHYKRTKNPKILIKGDSISTDSGAGTSSKWLGYAAKLRSNIASVRGIRGSGYSPAIPSGVTGWQSVQNEGIAQYIAIGEAGATRYPLIPSNGRRYGTRTVDIVYGTRPDGGTFNIYNDTNLVASDISCQGAKSDINIHRVSLPELGFIVIEPIGKTYISGFIDYDGDATSQAPFVFNVSHGGIKATDYEDSEIEETFSLFTPDLTIYSLGNNDYAGNVDSATLKSKIEKGIIEAKKTGDVLLLIQCGNDESVEGGADYSYFQEYKSNMYEFSKKHNCALVDIDKLFGGFTKANSEGLIADTIHPNEKGHDAINNVLTDLLITAPIDWHHTNIENDGKADVNIPFVKKKQVFDNFLARKGKTSIEDKYGNIFYYPIQPILSAGYNSIIGNSNKLLDAQMYFYDYYKTPFWHTGGKYYDAMGRETDGQTPAPAIYSGTTDPASSLGRGGDIYYKYQTTAPQGIVKTFVKIPGGGWA